MAVFDSEIVPISDKELIRGIESRCTSHPSETELWPLKFLSVYRSSNFEDLDALELAIRCTHKPTDLQDFLLKAYWRHIINEYAEEVEKFREFYKDAGIIAAHVSCHARRHLAQRSVESFEQSSVAHLIVVGQVPEQNTSGYHFDPGQQLLTLPAPDNWEGLPKKMALLFRFLGFTGIGKCIMKLDDDVTCNTSNFNSDDLFELINEYQYLGRVNKAKEVGVYRWWHLGKCQDPKLNISPYGLLVDCDYATGLAYFLGPRAVNILARSSIYHRPLFEVEIYEDIVVGKVLKSYGIEPYHYNPLEFGILRSAEHAF